MGLQGTHSLVVLLAIAISSALSLLSTTTILLASFFKSQFRSQAIHRGVCNDNWHTRRMDSPTPSGLTRPSGDTFMQTVITNNALNSSDVNVMTQIERLHVAHAVLDQLSQLVFLIIIVSAILGTENGVAFALLGNKLALFVCSFVLAMRLLAPLATTIFTISSSERLRDSRAKAILVLLGPPTALISLLMGTAATLTSRYSSQSASGILLLSFIVVSLSISTFVSMRLTYVKKYYSTRQGPKSSLARRLSIAKGATKDAAYMPSTMSTAGTKASSANPYDAALRRSMLAQSKNKEEMEYLSTQLQKDFMPLPSLPANQQNSISSSVQLSDSRDASSLWLEQVLPEEHQNEEIIGYDEICSTGTSEQDRNRRNGTGTRLRVHSSARDLMTSFSSAENLGTFAQDIQLPPILFALGSTWLISILCIPLLITTITLTGSETLSLIFTICFCFAMALSGPLLLLQSCLFVPIKDRQHQPVNNAAQIGFLPRPSFASSYFSGRLSKASGGSFMKETSPVAGNGFETVNGYDTPVLFRAEGSSRDQKVKSVAFSSQHWTAGKVSGDRVVSSQGILGRAANIMSPRPKLQILSTQYDRQTRRHSTMPGHLSTYSDEVFEDESGYDSVAPDLELRDISETSAMIPGAMPFSPMSANRDVGEISLNLQDQRRIHTIYEVDSSQASSKCSSSLRQRRASVIGLHTNESWTFCSDPGLSRREEAMTTSHNVNGHKGSLSLSVTQKGKSEWTASCDELGFIEDVSISDIDLGDISNMSFVSAKDSDTTERGDDEKERQQVTDEKESEASRNWTAIDDSSEKASSIAYEADISSTSSHSLAGVMGILDPDQDGSKVLTVVQSTPPLKLRKQIHLRAYEDSNVKRKSLGSEMGLENNTAANDSPCRTSSDLSSLQGKRNTLESITDSFASSGCAGNVTLSPDGTIERVTRVQESIEREIIVIEMDESTSLQSLDEKSAHSIVDRLEDGGRDANEEFYTYTTHQYYQHHQQGNWLDPVEEVTEEPTICISAGDSPSQLTPKSTKTSSNRSTHKRTMTPQSEAWAKLHGFATPSSIAQTPQSTSQGRYGWAEVIESGQIASRTCLTKGRKRTSIHSISSISSTPRSRMEVNLSPHARAYLASRVATPSRLIGLQSKFWSASPPKLALDTLALQHQRQARRGRSGGLMSSMSPLPIQSKISSEEASWVDGAIGEEDEEDAIKQMKIVEKKWKRKSRSMNMSEVVYTSPAAQSGSRKRSSANLQGIVDAALRRGSGAFKMASKRDSVIKGSKRSSVATHSTMTPTIIIHDDIISADGYVDEEDGRSNGNNSDVKVNGSSTPSTPRRVSTALSEYSQISSSRAPSKREGSVRSAKSQNMMPESPSSGKGGRQGSAKRRSVISSDKRCSPLRKVEYRVHHRKESRVRETVKLLESAVRTAMREEQRELNQYDEVLASHSISPRKKVHARVVVRGSPGKFRLEEAATDQDKEAIKADNAVEATTGIQRQVSLRRRASDRVQRFAKRRNYPQIFVRPPSGSSTHTQQLLN